MLRSKGFDIFLEQANQIHKFKYNYDFAREHYKGAFIKIKILCPKHGLFAQTPDKHINQKQGCYLCGLEKNSANLIMSQEIFISKAKEVHSNLYDYSKTIYNGANNKVVITCKIHGEWKQTAMSHLKGHKCPKCTKNISLSKEEFISKAMIKHGNIYDYSEVIYKNAHSKVKIICKIHGEFAKTPSDHIYSLGKGCPKCKESKGERIIRLFLEANQIEYIYQKRFTQCTYNQPLPFDFFLVEYNTLIEYDGRQHFIPFEKWGGLQALELQKTKDIIKTNFALNNGFKLLRIKYTEVNKINLIIKNFLGI
jgi:very-short-patch-repair endonuclease